MGFRLDNFPIIKNSQENDTEALDYFRIFIHGAFLQKSMNFETKLAENCDSVQNFVTVLGNYDYTGLICIQDEIMNVTSSEIIDENTTKFSVDRAYLGSVSLVHDTYEYLRSVMEITEDTMRYEYDYTACNVFSDLFQPTLTTSEIVLGVSNMKDWFIGNPNRLYNTANRLICYIYEGENGQLKLQYTGFAGRTSFDTFSDEIVFSFDDKKTLWWDKEMDKDLIFKDKNVKYILSETLDYPIEKIKYSTWDYKSGNLKDSDFLNCDLIGTAEVENYSDFLKLISTLGIRMCFDQYEDLLLFSDLLIRLEEM